MKASLIYTVLATLALREVSAVAIPEPEPQPQPQKYKIADTELGPVYSNVDPNQPRDLDSDLSKRSPEPQQKYKIADSELGPVYSTVNPNQRRDLDNDLSKRGEAYTPLTPEDAAAYAKENGLVASGGHDKRSDEPLEKRDWAACVACVAACGLMQQGISLLSTAQQVQFCLGNCVLQGACSPYFRAKYGDQYGSTFPPQPAGAA